MLNCRSILTLCSGRNLPRQKIAFLHASRLTQSSLSLARVLLTIPRDANSIYPVPYSLS